MSTSVGGHVGEPALRASARSARRRAGTGRRSACARPAATRSAIIRAASDGRRPADRRAVLTRADPATRRRLPQHEIRAGPRRAVLGHRHAPAGRSAAGGARRIRARSPRRARPPGRSRTSGPAGSAGAARARRASRRRRGRRGTRRPPRSVSRRSTRAQRWCAGRTPRCSMSGLVSIQFACARAQSRSAMGVSPS